MKDLQFQFFTLILVWSPDSEVQMSVVDCGEWTHLCAAQPVSSRPVPFQPVTAFPHVLVLRPQESAQLYTGMLDAEVLHRFIIL